MSLRIGVDTDNEDDEVPWGDGRSGHLFGGNVLSHFMRDMEQMNREMANMFQSFEIGFPSEHSGNPQLPSNPRDDMLKKPDSTPEESGNDRGPPDPGQRAMGPGFQRPAPFFGGFFSPPRPGLPAPSERIDSDNPQTGQHDNSWMPHMRSFTSGRSVSVSTSIGPNGQVEERRTVRDSEGGEEVTITRKQGSQAHSVITKTDKSGVQEKIENFTNMNENDISDFNNRWNNKNEQRDFSAPSEPNSLLKSSAQPCLPQLCPPEPHDSDKDTVLTSRLKRLFEWMKPKVD
ncbi:HCLS1-associated protein X-1-like isoform X2 [Mizuhopecten yessoensis]|uniref:HCLS1-associated protein X-1-like isoform X2 n=1 Tax=Mizuhopecten yessoensis TaxID=6573 RepID=UPI000B45F77E|nr:HCLS1-associated protein X-1-like isoform X2 [Mizuhopecten yessoensis]